MKIDARKGDLGDLYDAHGVPIRRCVTADTETGVCTVVLGQLKRMSGMIDPTCVEQITFDAPLKWVPAARPTDDNGATI